MKNPLVLSMLLAVVFIASCFAQQTAEPPYITRGNWDLGISGQATFPHGGPGGSNGSIMLDAGYFVTPSSMLGGRFSVAAASGFQAVGLSGHYRYLVHTRNPKLFPFVGVAPGVTITHSGDTNANFSLIGEVGLKYFLVRHVAFEPAYRLTYIRASGVPFDRSSISSINLGLAFTF